ncbi:MAG: ribbon-helix-helix domain-containing protein [Lachnospiraceae bacterium]|nr:ribbon-helix-helix domain-containing protein [Lachnospiraceae bacterium]
MSPRTGRPKSDNSKDTMLRVRIDEETVNKLEIASKELSITKSEVVRNGIENEYRKAISKK